MRATINHYKQKLYNITSKKEGEFQIWNIFQYLERYFTIQFHNPYERERNYYRITKKTSKTFCNSGIIGSLKIPEHSKKQSSERFHGFNNPFTNRWLHIFFSDCYFISDHQKTAKKSKWKYTWYLKLQFYKFPKSFNPLKNINDFLVNLIIKMFLYHL